MSEPTPTPRVTAWVPDPELVERWAKHRLEMSVGDGYVGFRVICGHDLADETRPCWPYDTERDDPIPLPAPQPCNLTDWIDNLDPEDWLHGEIDFLCGLTVEWGQNLGGPIVHPHPIPSVPREQVDELIAAAQAILIDGCHGDLIDDLAAALAYITQEP